MCAKPKTGSKQKLSPAAAKRKAARDKKIAMTPARRAKKAENQRKRREAEKNGQNIDGKDWNHKTSRFDTVKNNRGNFGMGTKKEGNKKTNRR